MLPLGNRYFWLDRRATDLSAYPTVVLVERVFTAK